MRITNPKIFSFLIQKPINEKDNRLYFLETKEKESYKKDFSVGINSLKTFLKNWPGFYNFLQAFFTPAFSPFGSLNEKKILKKLFNGRSQDKLIINLGSGTKRLHEEVINIDIYPFKNVDIIANAKNLPFKDGSVDAVIIDSALEHIPQSEKVIEEISRIVKKGGHLYVTVPFMYPYHASPNDYKRWTKEGLKSDFNGFRALDVGMRGGPMGALQGVLMHIFALVLSFGIDKLYVFWSQFFMVIFSPLKILDIFFLFLPHSHEVSAHLYFLGIKK